MMNGFSILFTKGAVWASYVPHFNEKVVYIRGCSLTLSIEKNVHTVR